MREIVYLIIWTKLFLGLNLQSSATNFILTDSPYDALRDPRRADSTKIDALIRLAWDHEYEANGSVIQEIIRAIELAKHHQLYRKQGRLNEILIVYYSNMSEFQLADRHYLETVRIYELLDYKTGIGRAKKFQAHSYLRRGDLLNSERYFLEAHAIFQNEYDSLQLFMTRMNLGELSRLRNKNAQAYHWYTEAHRLTLGGLTETGSFALLNEGLILHLRGQNAKAIQIARQGIKKAEAGGASSIIGLLYVYLAEFFAKTNMSDSALFYLQKAQNYALDYAYVQRAIVCYRLGVAVADYDVLEALRYSEKALEMFRAYNMVFWKAQTFRSIGDHLIKLGNLSQAKINLDSALALAAVLDDNKTSFDIYKSKITLDSLEGDHKSAFRHFMIYNRLNDELFMEDRRLLESTIDFKYASDYNERQVEKLTNRSASSLLVLERQKVVIAVALSGLLIAILLIVFFYRSNNKKVRSMCILRKYANDISRKKSEVERQRDQLEEVNLTKDKFFTIVAHDLKGPISALQLYSEFLTNGPKANQFNKEFVRELGFKIGRSIYHLRNFLDNLLNWANTQTGKLKFTFTTFGLSKLVGEVVRLLENSIRNKNLRVSIEIPNNHLVYADQNSIRVIMLNILMNAIKFSRNESLIEIATSIDDEHIVIHIKDYGVGIPESDLKVLFRGDSKLSTMGTDGEKGSGLGLILCKEFTELNHGDMRIESKLNSGTSVFVRLKRGHIKKKANTTYESLSAC